MKAAADVEGQPIRRSEGPRRAFDRTPDLPSLGSEHWIDVHVGGFEPEDATKVLGLRGPLEVGIAMDEGQVLQPYDGRRPHLLRPDEAFDREGAQDLFAAIDFDTWDARGFAKVLDSVLRVVPEADMTPQAAMGSTSLKPSRHRCSPFHRTFHALAAHDGTSDGARKAVRSHGSPH
jgi:hypothetical protein